MTTYTLTQAQYDKLLEAVDFHSTCLDWLSALKPNSQEPEVWFCPDCGMASEAQLKCCPDWIRARKVPKNFALTCKQTFDRAIAAPISKEDMVKVLEALQSEVNNYEEDDPEDGAPENLYDARRIMQSAIEGMK
jgi:hypothetical protein